MAKTDAQAKAEEYVERHHGDDTRMWTSGAQAAYEDGYLEGFQMALRAAIQVCERHYERHLTTVFQRDLAHTETHRTALKCQGLAIEIRKLTPPDRKQ